MPNLAGIGLAGFRSFSSSEPQVLAPLTKVNLLVGQNNAGKSNVLDFVGAICQVAAKAKDSSTPLTEGQFSRPSGTTDAALVLTYDLSVQPGAPAGVGDREWADFRAELGDPLRLHYVVKRESGARELDADWMAELDRRLRSAKINMSRLSSALTTRSGGATGEDTKRVIAKIAEAVTFPNVHKVPAFRRVAAPSEDGEYGSGLITQLAGLERPEPAVHVEERAKFDAVQECLRAVYEDDSITLMIPTSASTISVSTGSKPPLPLNLYGAGIQQVVMLAVAAVVNQHSLLLLEEPEIHLHPIMQRSFLRFLADHTTNQYLIATHSAHMLDSDIASIFHVRKSGGISTITHISRAGEIADAAADLGYRASDLVQSNAVIWVEGPSDRTYINHWLKHTDPDLIEGIHYSIMFYGGGLIGHLSGDEDSIDEFIKLQRLNRNVAIVIDSDLTSPGPINQNKQRVISEVEGNGGLAWVTWGYTIENYIPAAVLTPAVKAVHSSARRSGTERRSNPLHRDHTGIKRPNKAAIAKQAVKTWANPADGNGDLTDRIGQLVGFIRAANGGIAAVPDLVPAIVEQGEAVAD